jgi:hypothetical protein
MHPNTTRALITIFLGIILMVPIIISAAAFAIGDRIQTTANLNVRATPSLSGHLLCIQPSGTLGTVIAGPRTDSLGLNDPYTWRQINYDTGCDGWSVQNYLTKVIVKPTPPTITITADATTISVGQSTVIHANFTPRTDDALADTDINELPPSGAEFNAIYTGAAWESTLNNTFTPTAPGTYIFKPYVITKSYPAWQGAPASQWVTVTVTAPTTIIATLSQNTATTTSDGTTGGAFTISWISTNATSCTLQRQNPNGGIVNPWASGVSGSQSASPAVLGTYHWWIDYTGPSGSMHQDLYHTVISKSDTTPPTTPTNLSGAGVSPTQINLTWTASTDNVAVTGYKIYRNGTQVGTSATNSYSDTNLTPATYYTYTVSAYDAAGNTSAQTAAIRVTTLFVQNNVGILCDPSPSEQTPGIFWFWQGAVSTCINQNPVTWAVGDFTGFYPSGDVSQFQRGVSNSWYGSEAVQFQEDTFGIEEYSDSVLPLLWGSNIVGLIIDYEYPKSNPPHPFIDPTKRLVWSIQLQIPTVDVTSGLVAAHADGYVFLQDTKSKTDIYYGAQIFDTRGSAETADELLLDVESNGIGDGWPIVLGAVGINGAYISDTYGSTPFQAQPWSGFKPFSFTISYQQMQSTIQALKAKYPTTPTITSLSNDPADYVLLSANLDPEMPALTAQNFGPGVFGRMELSEKDFNVSVQ